MSKSSTATMIATNCSSYPGHGNTGSSPVDLAKKAKLIESVLDAEFRTNEDSTNAGLDLWKLREFALTEGGLVNDQLRRRAWPKLVGIQDFDRSQKNKPNRYNANSMRKKKKNGPSLGTSLRGLAHDENYLRTTNDDQSCTSISNASRILTSSLDFDQIERDVARCTWHLLTGNQRIQRLQMEHKRNPKVAKLIRRKQRRLANLINLALVKSYQTSKLRYYQGYHDIACIFLATLANSKPDKHTAASFSASLPSSSPMDSLAATMGLDLAAAVLLRVSQSHLKDCLKCNFLHLQSALRLTLFPLLAKLDPDVHAHLYQVDMEPFFALSWVITWFAHDIRDTDLAKRLFDCFLVSHPLFPIYVSVAMIIHPYNRQEVLECPADFSQLHQCLTGLPKNSSMVGWKYSPGDGGYVSDDEMEDDDGTMSTGTDVCVEEEEFLLVEKNGLEEREGPTTGGGFLKRSPSGSGDSLISSALSSVFSPVRVSFQELINDAIDIMRRIPPRQLLPLAARYYSFQFNAKQDPQPHFLTMINVSNMFQEAREICFLHRPPLWALQKTLPPLALTSKQHSPQPVQRGRSRRGSLDRDALSSRAVMADAKASKQHQNLFQRRKGTFLRGNSLTRLEGFRREQLGDNDEVNAMEGENEEFSQEDADIEEYLREHNKTIAVIALGFGPGDDEERRRRKMRKLLIYGTVAFVVVTVAIGVAMRAVDEEISTSTESVSLNGSRAFTVESSDLWPVSEMVIVESSFVNKLPDVTDNTFRADAPITPPIPTSFTASSLSSSPMSKLTKFVSSDTLSTMSSTITDDSQCKLNFLPTSASEPFTCLLDEYLIDPSENQGRSSSSEISSFVHSPLHQDIWAAQASHYAVLYSTAKQLSLHQAGKIQNIMKNFNEIMIRPRVEDVNSLSHQLIVTELRPRLVAVAKFFGPTVQTFSNSVSPVITSCSNALRPTLLSTAENIQDFLKDARETVAGEETLFAARSYLAEIGDDQTSVDVHRLANQLVTGVEHMRITPSVKKFRELVLQHMSTYKKNNAASVAHTPKVEENTLSSSHYQEDWRR